MLCDNDSVGCACALYQPGTWESGVTPEPKIWLSLSISSRSLFCMLLCLLYGENAVSIIGLVYKALGTYVHKQYCQTGLAIFHQFLIIDSAGWLGELCMKQPQHCCT